MVSRWAFICSRTRITDVSREAVTVPHTNYISIITAVGNTRQGQPIEDLLTSFVRSVVARGE
jgi:hypothetical protein